MFGNMDTAQECVEAVVEAARSGKHNGYPSSVGTTEARQAVADYSTSMGAPATAGVTNTYYCLPFITAEWLPTLSLCSRFDTILFFAHTLLSVSHHISGRCAHEWLLAVSRTRHQSARQSGSERAHTATRIPSLHDSDSWSRRADALL